MATFFGVRHLSPAAAVQVVAALERIQPDLVLIEGPSDFTDEMHWFCHAETRLPAAILAYTQESPIQTILYPFANYSPEYQAILWAHTHQIPCRFMDLPSSVFLGIARETEAQPATESVYQRLEMVTGTSHNTFWERNFEQLPAGTYAEAANTFGRMLRAHEMDDPKAAENVVRESYMKRMIVQAEQEGYQNIFCVCGAYHVAGLEENAAMTDAEFRKLKKVPCTITFMPYSYYRLSQRSGYGAGNQAPAYFELLWDALRTGDAGQISYLYLTHLAKAHRQVGNLTSSAEVIEAVRLAQTLAHMRGSVHPVLEDLRDAAITCMGHGHFSEIAVAAAQVEVGKKIGALPDGVSRTAIQSDFYTKLKELKLEKYRTMEVQILDLDLRERLRVKSEKAAFLDLYRSFFLHQLRVLGIQFGTLQANQKQQADWVENWRVWWTPEIEMQMVEASLQGDTVMGAAAFVLQKRANEATDIRQAASIFEDAFLCGIPKAAASALTVLQKLAVDTQAIVEVSKTAQSLSLVIRYGDLRKFDAKPLIPLLQQFYLRACLTVEAACQCDDSAADAVMESIERIYQIQRNHEEFEEDRWLSALEQIAQRDDLNSKCSGFALGTLLECGKVEEAELSREVARRLSVGIPADLGAGWFEGLAQKNRYALIARLSLWRELDAYLSTLDEAEFRRALVFLRRAFCAFTPNQKSDIAENLGEIWGIHAQQTAEVLIQPVTEAEQEILSGLDDFDFSDI